MIINDFVVFGKSEKINHYRKFRVLTWLEIHAFYLKSSRIIALMEKPFDCITACRKSFLILFDEP
jgi:hypothetical protein